MKRTITFLIILFSTSISFSQTQSANQNNLNSFIVNPAISVTIGGDFPVTGSFPAFINERVDQFITRMYNEARSNALKNITDPELLLKISEKLNQFTLRDVIIKSASGAIAKIDLQKFRIDGDFKNNPYLKNDDVIIFPVADMKRNFFTVTGAVNNPGKFYFVEGDKLSDAIELALGINKAYENVTKAEIDRLSYDGQKMNSTIVDINSNVPLSRGDRIIVLADETQKRDFSVSVTGEVNRPGKIPITKDSTTLKEVIEKAGGFTATASLRNSRLFSGSSLPAILEKEYGIALKNFSDYTSKQAQDNFLNYENILMSRMSNLTEQDTSYFLMENQLRVLSSGGSVDFTKLNDSSSEASKYIVKDGDVIIVPQKAGAVYVFGQVPHPGRIDFVKGKNYNYYIREAGGLGDYADNDIMVIKASSREWVSAKDDVVIDDGDYIWVPKSPQRSFQYYLKETTNYLTIIGSIATIILLLIQIRKP